MSGKELVQKPKKRHRLSEFGAIKKISSLLSSTWELDEILNIVVKVTVQQMGVDVCSVYLFDEEGNRLILRATVGLDLGAVGRTEIKLGEGITGWAVQRNRVVAVKDVRKDKRYKYFPETKEERYLSMLSVPLILKGERIGVLNVQTIEPRAYRPNEVRLLKTIANQISGAIHNAQLYDKLLSVNRKLKETQEALLAQERLAALGEVSASMAHELRNPLSGLRGSAQLLRDELTPDDPKREYLKVIIAEVDRMDRLISELLLFARPKKERMDSVDLHSLVERVLLLLKKNLADNSIEISRRLSVVPTLGANENQLEQVVLNLFINAIQSMPEGGKIVVSTAVLADESGQGRSVFLEIADTGTGMSEETLARTFEPFFTTKSEGLGLGLAICRRIIEEHKGEIIIKSELNRGTKVTVKLPVISNQKT